MIVVTAKWNNLHHGEETLHPWYTSITNRKVEVEKMAKEVDLKKIISNLAKLGVSATMTKSRLEMLKALAPPVQDPQILSHNNSNSGRLFHAARV